MGHGAWGIKNYCGFRILNFEFEMWDVRYRLLLTAHRLPFTPVSWRLKNDLTKRANSITKTGECNLICKQEKRLDDPSSNSCNLVVVQMSQQDRGLGSVRLKFVSHRP